MRPGKATKIGLVVIGLLMWAGTVFFAEKSWWPDGFKNPMQALSGTVWGISLLLAVWIGTASWSALKAQTPVILSQNDRFLWNPNEGVIVAGKMVGIRLGGVAAHKIGISIGGNSGTLFVPLAAWKRLGNNFLALCVTERVPFPSLSPEVRKKIRRENLVGPYFVGLAPFAVETRGTDYLMDMRKVELATDADYHTEKVVARSVRVADAASRHMANKVDELGQGRSVSLLQRIFLPKDAAPKDSDRRWNDDETR